MARVSLRNSNSAIAMVGVTAGGILAEKKLEELSGHTGTAVLSRSASDLRSEARGTTPLRGPTGGGQDLDPPGRGGGLEPAVLVVSLRLGAVSLPSQVHAADEGLDGGIRPPCLRYGPCQQL